MDASSPRRPAWDHAVAVMAQISENIKNDPRVNHVEAAEQAGIAKSSLYRWLKTPPDKIDVVQISTLADWLHERYGHEDFSTLWYRFSKKR